jgi:hypothetical protein
LTARGHHFGFEMADGAGGDLHDRRARLAQPLGVVVRRQVAHDHARLQVRPQLPHALADKGGLARTGRGQEVQHQQAARPEEAAVALGEAVVLIENRAAHLDGPARFAASLVRVIVIRFSVRVGVGVGVSVGVGMVVAVVLTVVCSCS